MKNILIALSIYTVIIAFPMTGAEKPSSKAPWYENDRIYSTGVSVIDVWAKCKSSILLFTLKKAQADKSKDDPKTIISKKIDDIERDIREEERKAIAGLFDRFKVTPDKRALTEISMMIGVTAEQQYNQDPSIAGIKVQQDPQFPQEIFSVFKDYGIHPQAFNLLIGKTSDGASADTHASDVRIKSFIVHPDQSVSCDNVTIVSAPTMIVNPVFFTYPLVLQKAILLHEGMHAVEHHAIKRNMLVSRIAYYAQASLQEVMNNAQADELVTLYERQADLLSAVKNNHNAEIMRIKAATSFYPNHLHLKHYSQLADIDELYKLLVKFDIIETNLNKKNE